MPRRWPYCPPRRGRTTFSYMYLLLYQLKLQTPHTAAPAFTRLRRRYKYPGSLNTPPSAQIDDFPPLTSRSSVSGPCTRVVSHYPIKIRTGPVRDLLFPCSPALLVCPQLDRFTSYPPTSRCRRKITSMTYQQKHQVGDTVTAHACESVPP